jgi:NAD(P)H dehydrogenase (quinone)
MIVVTGGSGQLGRAIVEQLLRRVEPAGVGVSVRDPGKVADFAQRGVRVRAADFNDGDSLRAAFEGASQVLLISSNARSIGGDPVAQHRTAIAAARAAGARRILYTSHQAASATSAFYPARDHAATEALLAESGVPFTSLRNGYYATTVRLLLGDAVSTGALRLPLDGPVTWTAQADLAEAAAIILSNEGRFDGPVTLTSGRAVDLTAVAVLASELTGRPIRREVVSDEEHLVALNARGVPAAAVKIFQSIFAASRAGEFSRVDPTLEGLLGRPPLTVRDVLARALQP